MYSSSPTALHPRIPAGTVWPSAHKLDAAAILARRPVASLQELMALKSKGWEVDELNNHFAHQRRSADSSRQQVNSYWYKTMQRVMGELDDAARHVVPSSGDLAFLDVGCAPGGFSRYILGKNTSASGIGISLPVALGGHDCFLEKYLLSRFKYVEQDVLLYDLHEDSSADAFLAALEASFDLVIIDAHALRTYTAALDTDAIAAADPDPDAHAARKSAHTAYRGALLIGQIIIALTTVSTGGTVVAKLSHADSFPAAQLIYLFDVLSDSLLLHKPRVAHTNRSTFYAIAKGVGQGRGADMKLAYLAGLRTLWRELRFGGPDGSGRILDPNDLDFVVTAETMLEDYVDRLVELGDGVWRTQVEGLQSFFRKKGISGV
ncbi:hypothetical protein C2E23DRAFT_853997 [Lenzites betulinus]|nr:hypothetical protein C2E23DRAFT_853997 [Lenzites betulinus]